MIVLKEKDLKNTLLFADENYISNGHWLFKKNYVRFTGKGSRIALLQALPKVRFNQNEDTPVIDGTIPDMEKLLKAEEEHTAEQVVAEETNLVESKRLEAVLFFIASSDKTLPHTWLGMQKAFAELIKGYTVMARGYKDPVSIYDEKELIGLIMPVKLDEKTLSFLKTAEV